MHILEQSENTVIGKVARGSSAKRASALMNYGNLIAILVPFPLLIFLVRRFDVGVRDESPSSQPEGGVLHQQAAYRFYGVTGFFIVIATFIPGSGWIWHLIAWILAALILVPWSIMDLRRIRRDEWWIFPWTTNHPLLGARIPGRLTLAFSVVSRWIDAAMAAWVF